MGFPDRITPDLLQEVIDELQVRTYTELCRIADECEVSRTLLMGLKHGKYKSVPTIDRVTRVHRWLATHPPIPASVPIEEPAPQPQ